MLIVSILKWLILLAIGFILGAIVGAAVLSDSQEVGIFLGGFVGLAASQILQVRGNRSELDPKTRRRYMEGAAAQQQRQRLRQQQQRRR
ncbi:MAG: hypothetical protein ACFFFG_00180 [Candidatus Thorarchaeota archaeon]